jgi:ADP-heptose:LPS heptosyltransferase
MTENILIIKLGALGDFIQSLGPMQAIRKHHPKANITLLTTKPFISIAKQCGYFDRIEIDTRPKLLQPLKWLSLKKNLNNGKFSRVYDLQNNDRTGIYFKLFNPKPEWVGVAKGASHRNTSPERTAGLAFTGHQQTLGLAGIKNVKIDPLNWMDSDISQFDLQKPYALIVPGSAPQHPQKRWPHYTPLCSELLKKNIHPVLIGTDAEKETLDYIERKNPAVVNLCGKTKLEDLPALARNAAFAIGNDTGPMHLIAPTGCKTLVLFSNASNPKRHAPLGDNVTTLQEDNLNSLSVETVIDHLSV